MSSKVGKPELPSKLKMPKADAPVARRHHASLGGGQERPLVEGSSVGREVSLFQTPLGWRLTPISTRHIIAERDALKEGVSTFILAQTGTGKTLAYVLPIVHKLLSTNTEGLALMRDNRASAFALDQSKT